METKKYYRTRGEVLCEVIEAVGIVASILTILRLGLLFLAISGCDKFEKPLTDEPIAEEVAEESAEILDPADQVAVESTVAETAEVAIEAVPAATPAEDLLPTLKVYGTVPEEAKKSPRIFTKKKNLILVELAPFHPDQFTEEWVIKQISKRTGIELEEVRKVATEAAADAKKVLAVLKTEGALARYGKIEEKEQNILRENLGNIETIERGLDALFVNELGVTFEMAHTVLLKIHLQENPDDIERIDGAVYGYTNIVFIFGLGQMIFPEKSYDDCLSIYTMLARGGKTIVPIYDFQQ